jgi:ABC-type uncharacterized transport system auxiliary subunit
MTGPRRPGRRGGLAAAALAALALPGCVAGPAPRDHFYRLAVPAPAENRAAPLLPGTLLIQRLASDDLLRERPIVRRDSPDSAEVTPYAYHLWADSPERMLQQQLAAFLRAAHAAEQVVTPDVGAEADWTAGGSLRRLDIVGGAAAEVEIELWLRDARGRTPPFRQTYRVERPVDGDGVEAAVRALSEAAGAAFEAFLADLAARR